MNTVALICTIAALMMIILAIAAYVWHRRHRRMLHELSTYHVHHQQMYGHYPDSETDPVVELMRGRDGF